MEPVCVDLRGKVRVLGVVERISDVPASPVAKSAERHTQVIVDGEIGQQIHGSITAPQTIHVGRKKERRTIPRVGKFLRLTYAINWNFTHVVGCVLLWTWLLFNDDYFEMIILAKFRFLFVSSQKLNFLH